MFNRIIKKIKKQYNSLTDFNKKSLMCIAILFLVLFFTGIMTAYAYYKKNVSFTIYDNRVGDFEKADSDFAMIFYKQTNAADAATKEYVKTNSIPQIGYTFERSDCTSTCTTNQSDSCHYTYNINTNEMSITSNKKVSCRFYFKKIADPDVSIYIMVEDQNGSNVYNGNHYTEYETIPAFGYEYVNYSCAQSATVSYDAVNRKFNVSTTQKNTCYAYFNTSSSLDINMEVYVQSAEGSNVYTKVNTIPVNESYILSTKTGYESYCSNLSGTRTDDVVVYSGGYVTTTASEKVNCRAYLDISKTTMLLKGFGYGVYKGSIEIYPMLIDEDNIFEYYDIMVDGVDITADCYSNSIYVYGLKEFNYYKIILYAFDVNGNSVGYARTIKAPAGTGV